MVVFDERLARSAYLKTLDYSAFYGLSINLYDIKTNGISLKEHHFSNVVYFWDNLIMFLPPAFGTTIEIDMEM